MLAFNTFQAVTWTMSALVGEDRRSQVLPSLLRSTVPCTPATQQTPSDGAEPVSNGDSVTAGWRYHVLPASSERSIVVPVRRQVTSRLDRATTTTGRTPATVCAEAAGGAEVGAAGDAAAPTCDVSCLAFARVRSFAAGGAGLCSPGPASGDAGAGSSTARAGAWGAVEAISPPADWGTDSFGTAALSSLGSSEKNGAAVGAGCASGGGDRAAAYSSASLLFAASVLVCGGSESESDARREASSTSGAEDRKSVGAGKRRSW